MTAALEMSASATSQRKSEEKALDEAVGVLKDNADKFVKLSIREKRALLRESMNHLLHVAEAWVQDGSKAKGISPEDGEEWLTGPVPTMRNLRLLDQALARLEQSQPLVSDKQLHRRTDGRVEVTVFPGDAMDGALFTGFTVKEMMEEGMDTLAVKERAGKLYQEKDPKGGVSLILGAGNVSAIPPTDALYKSFVEGYVCIIKMNPVNEWVGPHLERAFKPFIDKGYLRIVYGAGDVGKHLVEHDGVEDIHITGSNHTHDLIVWGPPGEEREQRKRANDPVLKKRITSELGNVSPVAIVPAQYSESELDFMARNVAAMVTNNASFNCNAAKMLVTATGWAQREHFLGKVELVLQETPTRLAYYPGAFDRYQKLVGEREGVKKLGRATEKNLPWTVLPAVDASKKDDPLFFTEPFCAILSETRIDAKEPAEFITKATSFMNDTLWGTLNAMWIVPGKLESSGEVGAALDKAILELRYGTVAVNHWPALAFAFMSPCWGGHPSSTLQDVQSGIGWVHNTYMLEGVEKTVVRGPLTVFPKPAWFGDNKKVAAIGKKLLRFEHSPSWLKVPSIAFTALQG